MEKSMLISAMNSMNTEMPLAVTILTQTETDKLNFHH